MGQGRPTTQIDLWRRFNPARIPTQQRFLQSQAKYRLYSSGVGGGKSKSGCRESIGHAVRFPGSRNLIARLTATRLKDSTMVTFWREMGEIGFVKGVHFEHNKSEREITWWNGSTTIYRHLEEEEGMGSLEFSTVFVDEGSEVPDSVYRVLFPARLRWHLPNCEFQPILDQMLATGEDTSRLECNCPRRAWICTNPGASGYLRSVTEGKMPTVGKGRWEWFPAKPGENPFNGVEYYAEMQELRKIYGELWFRRYHDGDWSAFEGQRFPMFDRSRHVLDKVFTPQPHHEVVLGMDFGHRETFVSWIAFDPQAREPVVVFDELQVQEVDEPSQVADKIKEINAMYGLKHPIIMGDPAGVAANQFSSVSPIQAYGALGVHITPCKAGKSPQGRADLLTEFLQGEHRMYDGTAWPGIVFGPNCVKTIDSIVNLRWKPQSSRLGEDPREQFLKKDDHGFDACLVPGTLVETVDGPKPIEEMRAGDFVRTRKGPRIVERAWMTSPDAPVLRVETSDGRVLTGTGNHLVFSDGDWVRLDSLTYGDTLYTWTQKSRSSTECASTDTPSRSIGPTASTSPRTCTPSRPGSDDSTRRCGSPPTGRSLTDTTSTTATATRSTTSSTTSSASIRSHTPGCTSPTSAGSGCETTPPRYGRSRRLGTLLRKAALGTLKTAAECGRSGRPSSAPASGAMGATRPGTSATTTASAPRSAALPSDGRAALTTRTAPADSAAASSGPTATRAPASAPAYVVSVTVAGTSPVYDLTVEGEHEFFANGVLVHNCSYGLVAVPPPSLPPRAPARMASVNVGLQAALEGQG